MNQNLFDILWNSFKKMWGVPATVFGIILGFLMWLFVPEKAIPFYLFIIVCFILLMIALTFLDSLITTRKQFMNLLPKIILARQSTDTSDSAPLCLLEPSVLFSFDTFVSAYYVDDDGFELLLGTGLVLTIQEDKRIQVIINKVVDGQEEIINRLRNNDSKIIQKVKIKPSIPRTFND